MSDDDGSILDQADRLMQRHRVFVAGSQASVAASPASLDDLPVLTDMVGAAEAETVVATPPTPAISIEAIEERAQVLAHELMLERLAAQRQTIEKEVIDWLDTELPQIVTYVIDGLTDQLVAQVMGTVRLELLPKILQAIEAESPPPESQPSRHAD